MRQKTKVIKGETLREDYEVKPYLYSMNVEQARTKYRQRYYMLKYCKVNYLNDPVFKKELYKCRFCPAISSQSHLMVCPRYDDLRRFRDLDDEDDVIDYLVEVMRLNNDEDDEEEEEDEV